jgi:SAM-dependent methyltransferase
MKELAQWVRETDEIISFSAFAMALAKLSDDFYDKIKPRLYQRVGRELRVACRVLDLGCGACELAQYLSETYGQKVTGVDISANSLPRQRKTNKHTERVRCIRKDAARLPFIPNEIDGSSWAYCQWRLQSYLDDSAGSCRRGGGLTRSEVFHHGKPREAETDSCLHYVGSSSIHGRKRYGAGMKIIQE